MIFPEYDALKFTLHYTVNTSQGAGTSRQLGKITS
jgi:hypothetical protein